MVSVPDANELDSSEAKDRLLKRRTLSKPFKKK